MDDVVKSSRRYRSPKRDAQAAATRAEIVDAARALFIAKGYVRTTLADIAESAGVSVPTVKLAFGTKKDLLVAASDSTDRDEPSRRAAAEREQFNKMLDEPDPRKHLHLQVSHSGPVKARLNPIIETMRSAASSDDEIAALWSKAQQEFRNTQHQTIKALQQKGKLRKGLTEATATDLLIALNGPSVYDVLVTQLGWTNKRYEKWLTRTLIEQLLEPEDQTTTTE